MKITKDKQRRVKPSKAEGSRLAGVPYYNSHKNKSPNPLGRHLAPITKWHIKFTRAYNSFVKPASVPVPLPARLTLPSLAKMIIRTKDI